MQNTLTEVSSMIYLLQKTQEEKMKGQIRAKGRCPVCNKDFSHVQRLGFVCQEHKTVPSRYYIDLSWKGQRIRIFSDKQGQVLDSYQRTVDLLSHINYKLKDKSFNPSDYVKAELEKFYMSTLLNRFLTDKKKSIAPSRQNHYKRYTNLAIEFFKDMDIRDLRNTDIRDYKKHLIEKYYPDQPKQGKTLKNILDHLKAFFYCCKKEEGNEKNKDVGYEILDKIPSFPDIELQPYHFKWIDQEEQIELLGFVEDHHKPFIAFLMLHGCRPGEARALRCRDIDLKKDIITISCTFSDEVYKERRKGKGSKPVMIPIHSELYGFLEDRVKNNLPDAFIFTNSKGNHYTKDDVYRLWEKVRGKAAIDKGLRLYDATRHSFASNLVNSNTSIYKVSKLLGHSSVNMTDKFYAQADVQKLKTDIEKLSLKRKATVTRLSPEAKGREN